MHQSMLRYRNTFATSAQISMLRRLAGLSNTPGDCSFAAHRAKSGRADVSETASISRSIAARYATAVFEIAEDSGELDALEKGVADLGAALDESEDLRKLIASPLLARREQRDAIRAVAEAMKVAPVLRDTLALMADKRRLFAMPALLAALRDLLADHRGEVVAEVTSARALSSEQTEKLAAALSRNMGKTVTIHATTDEELIGGLVVKMGSKMIDTSIRARLASLQNAMKEVG
ncbi:ATP synthase F1 subcomplex delta subunit [Pontibaca methylaminivorans]|uniref:ATP synthase subunit delta n=1 Tax=Pontibaca methylaminivorans TaxID=515897 RepID=A0A1R3WK04_9RHOB|nr:ATP synthase F1 subcomplex delta subunit [Pontibaca methylaminivorans]